MWKQLLRVRSIKESSDLAVSESLGGLHPKVSKCLSEDESQGINGPKTFKVVPEGMPCSSRDCEGDSSARNICASFRSFDCLILVPHVRIASCELSYKLCYISFCVVE